MKYYLNQCGTPYVVCISENIGECEITKSVYDAMIELSKNAPKNPTGYENKLKADTMEWELVELPEPSDTDEDATESDYINALHTIGVNTNEEN